ncbi:MAG: hypothetical protein JF590_03240 [Gemmatimonadetes bacterium]|nr:hypothetical protein [Gemmatimonadota bacterium]
MRHWMIPLALLAGAGPLAAQGDCTLGHLPDNTNEAEIFRIRGASTAFGRASSPMMLREHSTMVLFELTTLSNIDAATRTPTYCNVGKPPENANLLPIIPRPRIIFGLSDEFSFEVSWIPPITVQDVKSNVVSFALARSVPLAKGIISLRGSAVFGVIRAPITCTKEQIAADSTGPYQQCAGGAAPSNDHYKPNSYGVDLAYGWPVAGGKLRPYLGAGVNFLRPRFQVDFTDRRSVHIDQKIEGNYRRAALFGGATWIPTERLGLTGEVYADPGTTVVGRVGVGYGLK